jgi:octaprenyl-diphosphate synthase
MSLSLSSQPVIADLSRLQALTSADMAAVDACIVTAAGSHAPLIPIISAHLTRSGGKRLRPMLTLAASGLCGYIGNRHIQLATAVEFIHTATLLHDDVVDESLMRRGLATAHQLWGNKASILVGDYLFAQAFCLMVATDALAVLGVLSKAAAVIVEGEVLQLAACQNIHISESDYRQIIAAKTAALFAAATEVGAVIANRPEYREALRDFGYHLGMAFQLMDDLLDYQAEEAKLGKTVGDDFREGKVTLPVIHAYAAGNPEQKQQWEAWFAPEATRDTHDLEKATGWMQALGSFAATHKAAQVHGESALQALRSLPASAWRMALEEAVGFCLARGY